MAGKEFTSEGEAVPPQAASSRQVRWGLFGEGDRKGTLNFIDRAKVLEAVSCVRLGEVFSLNAPLEREGPIAHRPAFRRNPFRHNRLVSHLSGGLYGVSNDDAIEISMQGSSHWDAFSHFGAIEPGVDGVFYGGATLSDTGPEPMSKTLGIDAFLPGIVTRGVVLDLVRALHQDGAEYLADDVDVGRVDIERCVELQGSELRRGDVVLLYTGYEARHRAGAVSARDPGIDESTMSLWIEKEIAALASDNISVEAYPSHLDVHVRALRDCGIPLGELWALEELVQACRVDGTYEFLLTSAPLNVTGAFGSPANALAIR